jgi:hypothetical protein
MTDFSRRNFIKQLGAFAALAAAVSGRDVFSQFGQSAKPFDLLVAGDSVIWGQGLREEEKFYSIVKNWLETEVFKGSRQVEMKVLAHSGANINLRDYEIEALKKAKIGETEFFHREINVSFPSINAQIDLARRREYAENPSAVDLILLMGGVTDVRLTQILDPRKSNDELRRDIARHCNEAMFGLLKKAAENFPNALIALAGYYPPLSKYTPGSRIFSNLLELYSVPQPFKAIINNPLNRQILKYYRQKMVTRSLLWANDSNAEFKKAVARLNAESGGKQRAIFIESPLTEENSLGAKKSMLYEIKNGRIDDALFSERKNVCKPTLDKLRAATNLKLRTRTCEFATVGHPNAEGARAYAAAIKNTLESCFEDKKEFTTETRRHRENLKQDLQDRQDNLYSYQHYPCKSAANYFLKSLCLCVSVVNSFLETDNHSPREL